MTEWWVELSGENLPLALAELEGALEALGGRRGGGPNPAPRIERVELPDRRVVRVLAGRLALSRRVVEPWSSLPEEKVREQLEQEGARTRTSASFRPLGRPTSPGSSALVAAWARAWKAGGGRVDLTAPERRFVYLPGPSGRPEFGEEVAAVDRSVLERRRMPNLPFQRPVSLRPRLARAAVNLAAIRPGDRVVDPFVGTGALLVEAAILGARVCGIDRDPTMVRGALRNFAHAGVEADRLFAADAEAAAAEFDLGSVRAIVTDPPYGRASPTAGELPGELVRRALTAWSDRIAQGGRIVLIGPGGTEPLDDSWSRTLDVADRVHGSLTREFRVYRRTSEFDGAAL